MGVVAFVASPGCTIMGSSASCGAMDPHGPNPLKLHVGKAAYHEFGPPVELLRLVMYDEVNDPPGVPVAAAGWNGSTKMTCRSPDGLSGMALYHVAGIEAERR